MNADAVEIRVLGCLVEKQRTTPDAYPLSLNSLRLACNQTTNRDPIVDYDEATIRAALERLWRKQWVRLASGSGSRAVKYRHLLEDALALSPAELSLLAVLMLRGTQTPGELKQRTERLHRFDSLEDVEGALNGLIERDLVAQLPRRPGQKEERYAQLVGGDQTDAPSAADAEPGLERPARGGDTVGALEQRISRLENEVASLRSALERLQLELGGS